LGNCIASIFGVDYQISGNEYISLSGFSGRRIYLQGYIPDVSQFPNQGFIYFGFTNPATGLHSRMGDIFLVERDGRSFLYIDIDPDYNALWRQYSVFLLNR